MDIVDIRSFQKNALPILRSQKVLKGAVRSIVGPAFPLKLDKSKLLSDPSLEKEKQDANQKSPIYSEQAISPSRKQQSSDNLHVSLTPSKIMASSLIEEESTTPRTHTSSIQSEKRPPTSDPPLPYHTSQSIQEHKAKLLGFEDFIAHRQVSPSASIAPSIYTSIPQSTKGRMSPPLTEASTRQRTAATPMSPELSAAHNLIDIKGRYIPSNAIKDAMISTVRRHTDILNREVLYSTNTPSLSSSIADKDNSIGHSNGNHLLKENSLDAPFSQITVDDSHNLGEKSHPPPMAKIQSMGNMTKGELGFNDSIRSLPISDLHEIQGNNNSKQQSSKDLQSAVVDHPLIGGNSRAISTKDIDESAAWKSLLSSTSRAKLASIVRVEDDYSMKWTKMKARRDAQRQKEETRQEHLALRHFFRRVQINSEQNNLHQVKAYQQQEREEERNRYKKQIEEYHHLHDAFYHQKKAQREKEKQKETRQLKRSIARSVAEARRLVENEIAEHHASVLEQKNRAKEARWQDFANFSESVGWVHPGSQYLGETEENGQVVVEPPWGGSLEELSSFTGQSDPVNIGNAIKNKIPMKSNIQKKETGGDSSLLIDDSVSSVVDIPAPLQRKLKNATSLRVHQEVKKEIKDYYDSVMSMRIHRFVHSKDIARRHAADRERANISKTPFHAGMYFTDSFTLNSAMDDSISDHGQGGHASPGFRVNQSRPWSREEALAMRAVSAALTDPAATPIPPYHLDPLVVAETYGISLSPPRERRQSDALNHHYQHLPTKSHHSQGGVNNHHMALHPGDSAYLLMRHTPLTPLTPTANVIMQSPALPSSEPLFPSNLQHLQEVIAEDPQRELTDEDYAAYIAAAAAAVTSGMESSNNQQIMRSDSNDGRTNNKKSVRYADSFNSENDESLPPTSLGAKKKSMIMKSFSGLKNSFSSDSILPSEGNSSTTVPVSRNADIFQLPGSKRSSVDPLTTNATYASLLRSKSIRKSMSGFLPINAANFDAQTEQQTAILDKFQKKSSAVAASANSGNTSSSTVVRKSVDIVSIYSLSKDATTNCINNENSPMVMTSSVPSSGLISREDVYSKCGGPSAGRPSLTTPISYQETDNDDLSNAGGRAGEGSASSVASNSSQRSQQQVRLVLPPVGISRSNSSYSLNQGMSQPILLDEHTPSSCGY